MTEKFRGYLQEGNVYERFMFVVAPIIDKVLGRMSTEQLYDFFSANKEINPNHLRSLNLRGSQHAFLTSMFDNLINPDNGLKKCDQFLKTIQAATDKELYPGSFEDLGVERPSKINKVDFRFE